MGGVAVLQEVERLGGKGAVLGATRRATHVHHRNMLQATPKPIFFSMCDFFNFFEEKKISIISQISTFVLLNISISCNLSFLTIL